MIRPRFKSSHFNIIIIALFPFFILSFFYNDIIKYVFYSLFFLSTFRLCFYKLFYIYVEDKGTYSIYNINNKLYLSFLKNTNLLHNENNYAYFYKNKHDYQNKKEIYLYGKKEKDLLYLDEIKTQYKIKNNLQNFL